jgi:hypothetical protein
MSKKYWYYTTAYSCVLCGYEKKFRERQYTPKPENPGDRQTWHEYACDNHFI